MGSVYHLEEAKEDSVKGVHRLGRLDVRLIDSPNSGFIVHHNSESSLFVKVKYNQHVDLSFITLKELVLAKLNESFSLILMIRETGFLRKLMVPVILFIRILLR